ncbi:hypothetical protein [Haloquadratum walsbyi]|uniref:hypothetical protein n=1 Tax=Haloquadratum walsbyi TaxID=293091 RepID=UPI000AC879D9|nr:hypothetical protein [Haloquadratum walsbyi]
MTAQQNNTTATPPPSADLQGSHSPATVPTAVEPTGTSTPFRDIQEYQPTLPATATLTTRYPTETETETETQTQTNTNTDGNRNSYTHAYSDSYRFPWIRYFNTVHSRISHSADCLPGLDMISSVQADR